MCTCPQCQLAFLHQHQTYSCQERTVADFLIGKSAHTVKLFLYFIANYKAPSGFKLQPAKHLTGFASHTRFGYVHQLGKNFLVRVLHLTMPYRDTLCFHQAATSSRLYHTYCHQRSETQGSTKVSERLICN